MSSFDRQGHAQPEFLFELLDREAELVVGGIGSDRSPGNRREGPGVGEAGFWIDPTENQPYISFSQGSVYLDNRGTIGNKGRS
jgi:hypothetical protein